VKEVKVKKDELLSTLKENLVKHQQIFEEALTNYKAKAVEKLEQYLEQARRGERVSEIFHLPAPVNQTHEYKRTIRMVEMSVEEVILLTTQEFDAYVMDRWHWKRNFLAANSAYSVGATQALSEEE
jgi:hypothetical protein